MTIINQIVSFKLSGISYSGTSTQLNYTAGVALGVCSASKALVVDSFRNINNINTITATTLTATTLNGTLATAAQPNITSIGTLTNLTVSNNLTLSQHNGSTTGLILGSTLVTATGVQLNYNNITAPGTAQASKALILDSSSNITGINSLTVTSLELTNLTFNGTLLTVNGTQLNYNNITTPGVAQASRSLVLNSSSNISGINSLSATTLTATTLNGTLASGPQTGITGVGTLTSLTLNGPITGVTTLATSGNITCGGNLSATNLTGTIVTSSQPNITGVGTLSTLSVTGQITSGTISATNISVGGVDITSSLSNLGPISNVTAGTASASKALILNSSSNITGINSLTAISLVASGTITGSLATASQPGITSLGTLTSLALSGSITGATGITMNGGLLTGANSISATSLNGRIDTASQPNITSLGSLSSLTVTGSTGMGTTSPSRQLEINSSQGYCLRLSYGAPTGSVTNCTDFTLNSSGALTINSSNNLINLQSNVVIGKSSTENIIYFSGVTGDPGLNSTVIAERLYGSSDFSELLLFKGNDLSGSFGPDRIRMRAGEIRFQFIGSGEDYSTVADNNDALIIDSSGKLGINCSSPQQQVEINNATGNCLRLIYNNTANYSDINVSSNGLLNIKSSNNTVLIGDSTDTAQTLLIGSSSSSASTGVLRILTSSSGNYIQSGKNASFGSAADLIITNYSQSITNSERKIIFKADGKVGFGTSAPLRQLEINSSSGDCLRLTFNASSGSSGSGNIYCDQTISSIGGVTFTAAGSVPSFTFTSNSNSVTFNGNSITGTLATASQPNITSVGTLTNLSVSGRLSTSSTSASSTAWGTTGIQFNTGASTYTSTTAPSTTTVFNSFARPILAASSAATVTNASTLYIDNAPLAGTSITITNAYALHVAAGASLLGGVVSITDSSPSNSSTTGALRVTGGIYIGAQSTCAGVMNITNSTASALGVTGGVNIGGAVTIANNLTLNGTSNSLSVTGSSAYISITNNTASTTSTTGALRVAGGAYFGANSLFNANLTLNGAASLNTQNTGNVITTLPTSYVSLNDSPIYFRGTGSDRNHFLCYAGNTAQTNWNSGKGFGNPGTANDGPVLCGNTNVIIGTLAGSGMETICANFTSISTKFNNLVDGGGSIRSTGFTAPTSGSGIEMHFASNTAALFGYNRTSSAYLPLSLNNTIYITGGVGNGPFYAGIGTTSPSFPLHVLGAASVPLPATSYGYFNNGNNSMITGSKNVSAAFGSGIYVDVAVYVGSDYRIKNNIVNLDNKFCKDFIFNVNPVQYYLNSESNGDVHYGYIAQDLLKHGYKELINFIPDESVHEYIDEDGFKSPEGFKFQISYTEIIPLLANNIKELYLENEQKNKEIENLKQQIADIQKTLELLLQKN